MMVFLLTLIIVMGIHFFLQFFLLNVIGLPSLYVMLIVDLVMSFLFSFINYPSSEKKEAFKDPKFHSMVCIFFLIFVVFDLIFSR